MSVSWSRELISSAVDEAGETDRDQFEVSLPFAWLRLGLWIEQPDPPSAHSDRIRLTKGTDGLSGGKDRLGERALR